MIRRINLYGGPGSGKSTNAAKLFYEFKNRNYKIEHCTEYVKRWVYANRSVKKHDQIYLFAKQQQMEYSCIDNGVDLVITDSPCYLSAFYALENYGKDSSIFKALMLLNDDYENDFPSINIFIDRKDKPYHQHGRWQSKENAILLDKKMYEFINQYCCSVSVLDYDNVSIGPILDQIAEAEMIMDSNIGKN